MRLTAHLLIGATFFALGCGGKILQSRSTSPLNPGSDIRTEKDGSGRDPGEVETSAFRLDAPSGLCASKGNSTSYEFIDSVAFGEKVVNSGDNKGYRNGDIAISVAPGAKIHVKLAPGFNKGTWTERWAVYLDLNQDKKLTANELVYNGTSNGKNTLEFDLSVPAFAKVEGMLLRVAMRYGANPPSCGNFSWGEVEDYSLEQSAHTDRGIALDQTFGIGGTASLLGLMTGVAGAITSPDNEILAFGYADKLPILVKLDKYGNVDLNYGKKGVIQIDFVNGTNDRLLKIYRQASSYLLVGTANATDGRSQYIEVLHLNSNFEVDTSSTGQYKIPASSTFDALLVRADGGYYVTTHSYISDYQGEIAEFSSDGKLVKSIHSLNAIIASGMILSNGQAVLAGAQQKPLSGSTYNTMVTTPSTFRTQSINNSDYFLPVNFKSSTYCCSLNSYFFTIERPDNRGFLFVGSSFFGIDLHWENLEGATEWRGSVTLEKTLAKFGDGYKSRVYPYDASIAFGQGSLLLGANGKRAILRFDPASGDPDSKFATEGILSLDDQTSFQYLPISNNSFLVVGWNSLAKYTQN